MTQIRHIISVSSIIRRQLAIGRDSTCHCILQRYITANKINYGQHSPSYIYFHSYLISLKSWTKIYHICIVLMCFILFNFFNTLPLSETWKIWKYKCILQSSETLLIVSKVEQINFTWLSEFVQNLMSYMNYKTSAE